MSHRLFVSLPITEYRRYEAELLRLPLGLELLVDHQVLSPECMGEVAVIGAELRARGVRCRFHAPFRDLNPGGHDPEALALAHRRLAGALELTSTFGVTELVAHTAWDPDMYGLDAEAWIERSASFWGGLAEIAEENGARFALENVFDRNPDTLVALLERLPAARFGANFDVGHWHAYSEAGLTEWFSALGERLVSLHLHDNGGLHDDHRALGDGSVPWREFFAAVRATGRPLEWTLENRSVADVRQSVDRLALSSGILEFSGLAGLSEKP